MKVRITTAAPEITVRNIDAVPEASLDCKREWEVIGVYPGDEYQTFEGCGCSLTESACSLLDRLEPEERDEVLRLWFGADGVDARFMRTHIDSCDYCQGTYQAVKDPLSDPGLESFDISRFERAVLPYILRAKELATGDLNVLVSPWSPPAEWKTAARSVNDAAVYGGTDQTRVDAAPSRCYGGSLKPEFYGAWAKYLVKYIKAYIADGIPVGSVTLQNEPAAAPEWDSCVWTGAEMREFLAGHFYPELKKAGLAGRIEIFAWDHNKERMLEHLDGLIDGETLDMIDGVAFHWYSGDHFDAVRIAGARYPGLKLINSECCPLHPNTPKGDRADAVAYAHDMIGDLNAGMCRWIDWNVIVDRRGGPRHTPGGFAAPLVFEDGGGFTRTVIYDYIRVFSQIGQAVIPRRSTRRLCAVRTARSVCSSSTAAKKRKK